jgi:uncharacterized membrane protein
MKCYNHPEADAVGTCVSCKKAICSECSVEVDGRLMCRECLAAGKGVPASSDITDNDKMMALLSYVITFVVPVIVLLSESGKQRRFQRYHAVHALTSGIVLWAVTLLVTCLITVLTVGYGSCCAMPFLILPYIPMIYYGVQAYQGRYVEIPLVTDFVRAQGWV